MSPRARSAAYPAATSVRPGLITALVLGCAGVVLVAIGLGSGLTAPATSPGFASTVLLVVLAALPVLLALGCVFAGKPALASGVLAGGGVLTAGELIAAVQLAAEPNEVTRPELILQDSLTPLSPAAGTWLLLGGYLLLGIAALFVAGDGDTEQEAVRDSPQRVTAIALVIGLIAALATVLSVPFSSGDPRVRGETLFTRPGFELVGLLVLLVGVIAGPVLGALAGSRLFGAGMAIGSALGLAQFAVPQLLDGFVLPGTSPGVAPFLLLVCVLALLALGLRALRPAPETTRHAAEAEFELPGQRWLLLSAGLLGLFAALCALLAVFVPVLELPIGFGDLDTTAHTTLLPAGVLVAVCSLALLVPAAARSARPVFEIAAVALPLALATAGDGVSAATSIIGTNIQVTGWVWLLVASLLAIVLAVCSAAFAGGIERDEVDLSDPRINPLLAGLGGLGFLLGVLAFGLPVLSGTNYTPAGLWSDFRLTSWGMVLVLLTVLCAAAFAAFSRPNRAAGLLFGAALVFAVRVLEYPMSAPIVRGAQLGAGFWFALLAMAVFGLAALIGVLARSGDGRVSSRA